MVMQLRSLFEPRHYLGKKRLSALRLVCKAWSEAINQMVTGVVSRRDTPLVTMCDVRRVFPYLRRLILHSYESGFDTLSESLESLPTSLTHLELKGTEIGDGKFQLLTQHTQLTNLTLLEVRCNTSMESLSSMTNLQTLRIRHCPHFTSPGLRDDGLFGLQTLELAELQVMDDVGLQALSSIQCLTNLELVSLRLVSTSGLRGMFRVHTALETLKLSSLDRVNIDKAIESLPQTLTGLHIGYSATFTDGALHQLSHSHLKLRSFSIGPKNSWSMNASRHMITSAGVGFLSAFTSMTELKIESLAVPGILDTGFLELTSLPALIDLRLPGTIHSELSDTSLQTLSRLTRLQHLDLRGDYPCGAASAKSVGDGIYLALPSLAALKTLNLNYCQRLTVEGLKNLSSLTSLTDLNLRFYKQLPNESLLAITPLTQLTNLDLSGDQQLLNSTPENFGQDCIVNLASLTNLTTLNMSGAYNMTPPGRGGDGWWWDFWPALSSFSGGYDEMTDRGYEDYLDYAEGYYNSDGYWDG